MRIRRSIVAILIAFVVAMSFVPSALAASATVSDSIVGNPSNLNAHSSYTVRVHVTNLTGSGLTLLIQNQTAHGMYFSTLPTNATCTNPFFRRYDCTFFLAGSTSVDIDFGITVGQGWSGSASDYFNTDLLINGGAYQGSSTAGKPKGTGFYTFTYWGNWDYAHGGFIHYPHGTSQFEYTFLQVNYSGTRSGRMAMYVGNQSVITSISLCKWNGSACVGGYIGTATWGDSAHHSAYVTYTAWDNSTYALLVNWNTPPTGNISQEMYSVFTSWSGANAYFEDDVYNSAIID